MIFFKFILMIIIITAVTFIYRYFQAKCNYQDMRNLKLEYEEWLSSESTHMPNQSVFARLYEEAYGEKTRAMPHFMGMKMQYVDLVEGFPTKDRQSVSQLLPLVQNMEMHFREEFRKVSHPMYWVKFIIFLPQEIMQYLGIKPKLVITHAFNFLIWGVSIVISIFGSDIRDFVVELFK